MAKDKLTEYSATNASNDVIGDISVAEGMLPSAVNNALREQMTHLKNFSDGTDAIDALAVDNLKLDGNTISSTNLNGNVTIDPAGTGVVDVVGTLQSDGLTVDGDINFGDNDKAQFGAGSDLQIYHDGSSSRVVNATGNLKLQADILELLNESGTEQYLTAVYNGAVNLSHNNATKLATTSTGVDVTGTAKSDIVQLDAGSAPTWDTSTRLWTESGFGARYDGYQHRFDVGVGRTEAMRVDASGNFLVGTATVNPADANDASGAQISQAGTIQASASASTPAIFNRGGDGAAVAFLRSGSLVGSISITTTSTAYNTSSDYRLKENVTYDWDATTRLKQLKPARFNFIADADTTVDGFLAHEAQAVVPEAVTGTHNEVDGDGNPVMQGIDQSKLVPLLVKTIQELEARITALESN